MPKLCHFQSQPHFHFGVQHSENLSSRAADLENSSSPRPHLLYIFIFYIQIQNIWCPLLSSPPSTSQKTSSWDMCSPIITVLDMMSTQQRRKYLYLYITNTYKLLLYLTWCQHKGNTMTERFNLTSIQEEY